MNTGNSAAGGFKAARAPFRKRRRIVPLCAALALGCFLSVPFQPARADFAGAVEAFDNGRIAEALAEWQRLAETGDTNSQVALADMTLAGLGTGAGLPEAIELYRQAARRGDAVAQLNLGDFYARGFGLPRDPVRAYAWLSLAADQGRVWAAKRRNELAAGMTAEAVAEAKALAPHLVP